MLNTRRARTLVGRPAFAAAAAAWLLLATTAPGGRPEARGGQATPPREGSSFASQIAALSEPGGYFDTDNLISNERSYLEVVPDLARRGVSGGAYIGVGPDTNFSYIAAVRPSVAFIVDVRRDNLLLHLLFKALFQLSATRADYVALLLGRAGPHGDSWRTAPAERLVAHFAQAPRAAGLEAARRRVITVVTGFGIPLSAEDHATIARFHDRFREEGFALRFNSSGRAPRASYPTYGELVLEAGRDGRRHNYLASEEAFQFVKALQARDRIIPVVGDLGGPSAVAAIGRLLAARRTPVSAFYASNVEFYLFGDGAFTRFADNLRRLPRTGRSVVIRSVFGRYAGAGWGGSVSSSQLHAIDDLLSGVANGRYRSYGQLVADR